MGYTVTSTLRYRTLKKPPGVMEGHYKSLYWPYIRKNYPLIGWSLRKGMLELETTTRFFILKLTETCLPNFHAYADKNSCWLRAHIILTTSNQEKSIGNTAKSQICGQGWA